MDILNAPLSPAYPVGYQLWIHNWEEIAKEARQWYLEANGREPASIDIGHGLWRGLNEGERWGTLARAWQDTWPKPLPPGAPQPTREERFKVLANFCNIEGPVWKKNAQGEFTNETETGIMFTPFLSNCPDQQEWIRLLVNAGSTHIVLAPECAYNQYQPAFDLRDNPEKFADLVEMVSNTAGANGKAITPIIFLDNGGKDPLSRVYYYWPKLAQVLKNRGILNRCIVIPAWEPVKGDYTSYEMSKTLLLTKELFGDAIIGWHGSPRRWVGSSNPVEPDDPWQGGEKEFFKSHGGEHIEIVFYQAEADSVVFPNCNPELEECWLNRWEDGVVRVGAGLNGWRIIPICLAEGPAYLTIRGHATPHDARVWATAGEQLAKKHNVQISFMNGLPL